MAKPTDITHSSTDDAETRRQALLALSWIVMLARIKHVKGDVEIGNMILNAAEAANLIRGIKTLDGIREDRIAWEQDFRGVLMAGFNREARHEGFDDLPAQRHLPGMMHAASLKDIVEYEISRIGRAAEDRHDDMIFRAFEIDAEFAEWETLSETDQEKKLLDIQTKRAEEARSFKRSDLEDAHDRLVWVMHARELYDAGELYVRTRGDRILPAWVQMTITDNGQTISDGIADNRNQSCDGRFYDKDGEPVYSDDKFYMSIPMGRIRNTPLFSKGTPAFDDIEDTVLMQTINDFLQSLAERAPLLSLTLAAEAGPALRGVGMPTVDEEDLKRSFAGQREGWSQSGFFGDLYGLLDPDNAATKGNYTGEMAMFLKAVRMMQGNDSDTLLPRDHDVPGLTPD